MGLFGFSCYVGFLIAMREGGCWVSILLVILFDDFLEEFCVGCSPWTMQVVNFFIVLIG